MTSTQALNARWATNRSISALKKTESAMQPHMKLFDTPDGQLDGVVVSGIAMRNLEYKVSAREINSTLKAASQISGIPEPVWRTYYDGILASVGSYSLTSQKEVKND